MTFPKIKTERCILDKITNEDINTLLYIINDKLSKYYLPELYEIGNNQINISQIIKTFNNYLEDNEGILWGIRKITELIGFIAIMDISNNPTIFYAMHPTYRQKGYIKECLPYIIKYIFEKNICNYITSEVFINNKPSLHILLYNGFYILDKKDKKLLLRKDRYMS